jgi:uncharacterized protein YjiS (DUF1127 family)
MTSTERSGFAGLLARVGQALLARITRWTEAVERRQVDARGRRALARLDDAALKDIGISRADALQEASRSCSWWALQPCPDRPDGV